MGELKDHNYHLLEEEDFFEEDVFEEETSEEDPYEEVLFPKYEYNGVVISSVKVPECYYKYENRLNKYRERLLQLKDSQKSDQELFLMVNGLLGSDDEAEYIYLLTENDFRELDDIIKSKFLLHLTEKCNLDSMILLAHCLTDGVANYLVGSVSYNGEFLTSDELILLGDYLMYLHIFKYGFDYGYHTGPDNIKVREQVKMEIPNDHYLSNCIKLLKKNQENKLGDFSNN